jgi:tellurite resistance protein TerC
MLSGVMDKFHYLKYGLGLVLVFVGLKMAWLNELYHGHFPINLSLAIIATIISISILASFIFPKKKA